MINFVMFLVCLDSFNKAVKHPKHFCRNVKVFKICFAKHSDYFEINSQ